MTKKNNEEWWKDAVIYQVYPRSFYDSTGDGVGDLNGITQKIDYIASLGVDAIWISPFFKSPMKDYGYDVSDYRDVDPIFGTLADFEALLDAAHQRGIKIIIDLVFSHSSNMHEWFQQSRQSQDNEKADWYIWADPKPDGSPPNNWQSYFGGPSWSYEITRGQYYLHNFLSEQPDLNLRNPDVQDALLDILHYWMKKGVDGIRLDAIQCFFCSKGLEDNPISPDAVPSRFNIDFATPHTMQEHVYDEQAEPGIEFCKRIRGVMDEYEGRMAVAEIGGKLGAMKAITYTDTPQKLHTAYHFGMLARDPLTVSMILSNIKTFEDNAGLAWPSWAFANHDVVRPVTRWFEGHEDNKNAAKLLIALLGTLRGSLFLYQGDELGLGEATVPYEKIKDPWGHYLYPKWQGRDGCRTPLPWDSNKKNAGFSKADEPWLPVDEKQATLAVSTQDGDKNSVLNFTRNFMAWRKEQPTFIKGEISFIHTNDEYLFCFERMYEGQIIRCFFNLSDHEKHIGDEFIESPLTPFSMTDNTKPDDIKALPPFGFTFFAKRA
jgi:alpha-glucosidase